MPVGISARHIHVSLENEDVSNRQKVAVQVNGEKGDIMNNNVTSRMNKRYALECIY